jgi:hypothetical protein
MNIKAGSGGLKISVATLRAVRFNTDGERFTGDPD